MRIVDVLESRHRLSAPAHYCQRTWRVTAHARSRKNYRDGRQMNAVARLAAPDPMRAMTTDTG
jgi:hypothetical protein